MQSTTALVLAAFLVAVPTVAQEMKFVDVTQSAGLPKPDWPSPCVASPRRNVEEFLSLDLPDAARRAILWDNAARLF